MRSPSKRTLRAILEEARGHPTADLDDLYEAAATTIRKDGIRDAHHDHMPLLFVAFEIAYLSRAHDFRFVDLLLDSNPYMIHDTYRGADVFDYFFEHYPNIRNSLDIMIKKLHRAQAEIDRRRIEKMEMIRITVAKSVPRNLTRKISSYITGTRRSRRRSRARA
jgi:hypothetical protein